MHKIRKINRLIEAVTESACLKDITLHGMHAGWGQFIYYADCNRFYDDHGKDLMQWILDEGRMEEHAKVIYDRAIKDRISDVHTEYLYAALEMFASAYEDDCLCDECIDGRSSDDEKDNG